jgi:hypothetical protein
MVSGNEKVASWGKNATTSISESVHASSTVGLGIAGTICLNHVTAKGQTHFNNDFSQGHEALVRRSKKSNKINERIFGSFHILPEELQWSLILFGDENASRLQKSFADALEAQQEACHQKEEIALQKKRIKHKEITYLPFLFTSNITHLGVGLDDADNNYKNGAVREKD